MLTHLHPSSQPIARKHLWKTASYLAERAKIDRRFSGNTRMTGDTCANTHTACCVCLCATLAPLTNVVFFHEALEAAGADGSEIETRLKLHN